MATCCSSAAKPCKRCGFPTGHPPGNKRVLRCQRALLPAGQGYLSEGRYFLPLTSGQIAEIEMAAGEITHDEPASPNVVLGNLICYRGSVLSQSPLVLDKFEQLDLFQKRTESALAKTRDDATAIRELAEIKSAAGEKVEAVRLLKSALELAPEDAVTQEMLVELLLDQLASDYAANRADVPLVASLIRGREQQIELLRIDAAGIDEPDNRLDAWDAYLKLADFTAEEPAYLRIDDQLHGPQRSLDFEPAGGDLVRGVGSTSENRLSTKSLTRRPSLSNVTNRRRIAALSGTPRRASRGRRRATRACQFPGRARPRPGSRNRVAAA